MMPNKMIALYKLKPTAKKRKTFLMTLEGKDETLLSNVKTLPE